LRYDELSDSAIAARQVRRNCIAVNAIGAYAMSDFFHSITSMQQPFNMIVMVVSISCAAAVVKFVATEARKFGCHRQDIDFKREMVDRGLSADEIERILKAQSPSIPDKKG
jgi:hypothetical protein